MHFHEMWHTIIMHPLCADVDGSNIFSCQTPTLYTFFCYCLRVDVFWLDEPFDYSKINLVESVENIGERSLLFFKLVLRLALFLNLSPSTQIRLVLDIVRYL